MRVAAVRIALQVQNLVDQRQREVVLLLLTERRAAGAALTQELGEARAY
jgi:hypothetical protein